MSENANIAFGKLREQIDGDLAGDVDLPDWTGRVPSDLARALSYEQKAVGGGLGRRAAEAVDVAEPERVTRAVDVGNQSLVSFESGVTEDDLDSSPLRALAEFAALVRHSGRVLVLTGGTDNGKTNVGLLAADVADRLLSDLLVISNIPRGALDARWLDRDRYREVEDHDELMAALEDDPDREKFVLVDDASLDHGEGMSQSHEVRERAGRAVRLAAKRSARIAYLAHREDGVGVAKHIRSMPDARQVACRRILDDDGHVEEFVANISEGVGEEQEFVRTLADLPMADASYDPDAVAHELFAGGSE